ncbi:hypothetical protein XH83_07985 [Bradyrhizobium sp. CCBAU 53351]|nr:winged helix-turn-helix domain-containing protein [Bradyrhizobium sp. CCBAU 53351]QOZ75383.1 hypothetical protein XH83_07985 [Bradyrhizobium sp. CCBAU 53351]
MAVNPKPDRDTVRFGKFVLDLVERRLTFSGQPVKLPSRALDILCELASVQGEVVSKDRLMEKIWGGPRGGGERDPGARVRLAQGT